jgi:hypothetical protein
MTGPAMPSRMPKEPETNLMPMLRKKLRSRRARSATTLVTKKTSVKEWVTGEYTVLEEAEIQHEIYTEMKKNMDASGLKKTLCQNQRRWIFI